MVSAEIRPSAVCMDNGGRLMGSVRLCEGCNGQGRGLGHAARQRGRVRVLHGMGRPDGNSLAKID